MTGPSVKPAADPASGGAPAKLWAGRASGDINPALEAFNRSIGFDARLYEEDIRGSLVHAEMLGHCGIISGEDAAAICGGLRGIWGDMESGRLSADPAAEDIHTFIETELTRRIGEPGKRLHTGRSRNDQVAVDLRLYTRTALNGLRGQIEALLRILADRARRHKNTVLPGYTHLQRAQPVTLKVHLAAWGKMLRRDVSRIRNAVARMEECPLGAGALAGTTYPIDRDRTAGALGFRGPCENPLDAVSDRDFALETLSVLSVLMVHLSRMSEEIILWCSAEFGFARLPDAFTTGSSIMPQKKNPDLCELIRGKAGRVFGDLMGTLVMLKGLPLAYNKDMQEDKEALFDALDTVSACLAAFAPMMAAIEFNKERMRAAASEGFLNATDCADYLVGKGLPFREAYGIAGKLVAVCAKEKVTLETLPIERYKEFSPLFDDDVFLAVDLIECVRKRGLVK
ncbi:MAG: argininosuccinate lyase [Oscillospiraceae bacterium]|jgi:argininosuccinate lyase|nr:argininosuccinate lyase [Oscillospiraceae bacterium]